MLPVVVFGAEHVYLGVKYAARVGMEQLGSVELRQKKLHEYANRKEALKEYMSEEERVQHRASVVTEAGGVVGAGLLTPEGHTEGIRDEYAKLAEKTPERLRDIEGMIDYLKADVGGKRKWMGRKGDGEKGREGQGPRRVKTV